MYRPTPGDRQFDRQRGLLDDRTSAEWTSAGLTVAGEGPWYRGQFGLQRVGIAFDELADNRIGVSPMASAYDRMKDFLKMPEGQRDTSSRSSPSRSVMPILVLSAIDFSAICLRSRSYRSRLPRLFIGVLFVASGTLGILRRRERRWGVGVPRAMRRRAGRGSPATQ